MIGMRLPTSAVALSYIYIESERLRAWGEVAASAISGSFQNEVEDLEGGMCENEVL
jgi:hypothetical protein